MALVWKGVLPAVTTKFHEDFSIDRAWTKKNIEAQIDAGVDGIIVCGSLGEASTLSLDEKLEVLDVAVEAARGRVPVLLTIAENSTLDGCRQAERAASRGAAGYMVLPGLRYLSDRRETLHHFRSVANASPLPLMVYNNPLAYGVDMTPEMFAEIADEPKIVAIKESCGDVRRVTDLINAVGERYAILCGVDNLAVEAMLMGAHGWVAGLVCAFPHETVAIYRLVQQGRIAEALKIYRWFAPLLALDVSAKLVQNIKLAEAIVGLGTEPVRPPRLPLAGDERKTVEALIRQSIETRPPLPAN
ncbi:dihydrodipicolinate synthase family protein [Trinickia caryophylli]|uniref:4-hydroxy-tetrahydrodipicolinate synthase n=1 Tax=Trinickia caryophylli TaxID=28094 RepID=A0A1X7CXC1_TRICW|nr:dihydrodipicolinate synthase family protein [Trinickia caryophylli]PMS13454.1 dihydrodipicolinate synthase family protein [Trinickia caryophylli]TRX13688.1 dihydrodipicolinate synthase family protein [Trinickia caryophylli]WQE15272.1 dihydrodipicolinate synthase family protein [Trinickia caryophylli]SMF04741.1 4-hydroxy-tetrahydrodipicolinate synthase [Trinickia caryophylli]GLU30978.1 dihydrodipicolinate synthase family protein [Trinickia caryophylli]